MGLMVVLFENSNHGHMEATIINSAQRTDCRPFNLPAYACGHLDDCTDPALTSPM